MIERDYIMRLIRQFMAAIARFLEKKGQQDDDEKIKELYETYFGDYTFFHVATLDEVMESFQKYPEGERIYRIEMLAELYFREADLRSEPLREEMLEKAFNLFSFVDRNSKTYSFERINKINEIQTKRKKV